MRCFALLLSVALAVGVAGCRRGEEAPQPAPGQTAGLQVPDSTIVRELNGRLDIDPRLDDPEIQLEAHAVKGEVTLLGVVPSRYELSIALEVARSTPGVKQVWLDSVRVLSENPPPVQRADTAAPRREGP